MPDFDEPTNPLLADALRDFADTPDAETRTAVFAEFAEAPLMLPAKQGNGPLAYGRITPEDGESLEIILAGSSDGVPAMCAFINGAEFVAWVRDHPYVVMTGRELCHLAVSNRTPRVILNPSGNEMMFVLHADEIETIANGGMPDGVERPETTMAIHAQTSEPTPEGQLRIGPSPAPLTEVEAARVTEACRGIEHVTGGVLIGIAIPDQPGPVRAVVLEVDQELDQPAQEHLFQRVQDNLAAQEGDPIALGFTAGYGEMLEAAAAVGVRIF